jgi:hypothetical protein
MDWGRAVMMIFRRICGMALTTAFSSLLDDEVAAERHCAQTMVLTSIPVLPGVL